MIMNPVELKEIQRQITDENVGRLAVHVEYLVRQHPKFSTWHSLPGLAFSVAYAKDKKARLFAAIDVILFTLKQRKAYRI